MTQKRLYQWNQWEGHLPMMSCLCPTFGRPHLLREAVMSFLMQDYPGEKELIILNDHPHITIAMAVENPQIRVVNHAVRYETLGEKRNALAALAGGDVFVPWDDDDISLPFRLSSSAEAMTNKHFFKPDSYWMGQPQGRARWQGEVLGFSMCACSRELFYRVGGYDALNTGEDLSLDAKVKGTGLYCSRELAPRDTWYLYRFNEIPTYHTSWYHNDEAKISEEKVASWGIQNGEYVITPEWDADYVGMIERAVEEHHRAENPHAFDARFSFDLPDL